MSRSRSGGYGTRPLEERNDSMQFGVDERNQPLEGILVALPPLSK